MRAVASIQTTRCTRALHVVAVLATLSIASPSSLLAQDGATGSISGLAVDSLHGTPLVGALITVEGLGRSSLSDAAGLFRIDSVESGARRLIVFHPLLDTLGISVVTLPFVVVPDSTLHVAVAVPSASTVLSVKCGAGADAALLGIVSRADDPEPPEGALVVLEWTEMQIARAIGVRHHPRNLGVRVAADGTFRMCGAPSGVFGTVFAVSGSDTSTAFGVSFDEWPVLVLAGIVLPGVDVVRVATERQAVREHEAGESPPSEAAVERSPAATLRRGRAVITGIVADSAGAPVAGARVSLQGAIGAAMTDSAGRFALGDQPSGSGLLVARKLGLAPSELPVVLSAHGSNDVTIRMSTMVVSLAEVVVRVNRKIALERVGFYSRSERQRGTYFLDVERMDAMANRASLANVLAGAPNLRYSGGRIFGRPAGRRLSVSASSQVSVMSSRTCVAYIVDGHYWPPNTGDPTEFMLPSEVGALEVYRAGEVPPDLPWAQYVRGCEVVVIWTRHKLQIP